MSDVQATDSVSVAALIEVLEHAPIMAYLLRAASSDFVLEAVNGMARERSPALRSMLGRPVSLLYRDQPQIIEDAWRCLREQRPVVREVLVRRHDRVEANQKHRLVFVFVAPERLVIYAHDVALEANAEAALLESEERYRSLVASLPDAVLVRGADGRVLACNDVAVNLLGHREQADLLGHREALGEGLTVTDEHGRAIFGDALPSLVAIRTGTSVVGQLYTLHRADGAQRFVRVSVQPVRTRAGKVGGSVSLYIDETQRISAERAERASAERLEFALDAARMGSWEWEPETDQGTWSPSLYRHFDIAGTARGVAAFLSRVHPDDRSRLNTLSRDLIGGGQGETFESEFRIIGNDGATRWARVRGRLERNEGRVRMAGTLMDVTERRRLEDELRRAHRLESIGRLAGGLAHDFNNLLAAMLGAIELLEEVCPPDGREDLATVRHGAERARDLTGQLLAFARKQPIVLELVDLSALVEKVERLLRRLVGPTIELGIELEKGLFVRADAAQIEQVIVNLVVNARDAMPNGGSLWLRVRAARYVLRVERDVAALEVEDRGSGMDQETIRHIFDPFFTTKEHGTGLGLASSYGIVQQHEGDIVVESEPGRGARFLVMLPRVAQVPQVVAKPMDPPSGAGCVLIVDDDEAVRRTTARVLKSLGYDVLLAENGRQALEVAQTYPAAIDILVCDVAMPGRSGPDVARDVLGVRPNIRTLFVSGYPHGGESAVSAAGFLQKPYSRAALGEKLLALRARPSKDESSRD